MDITKEQLSSRLSKKRSKKSCKKSNKKSFKKSRISTSSKKSKLPNDQITDKTFKNILKNSLTKSNVTKLTSSENKFRPWNEVYKNNIPENDPKNSISTRRRNNHNNNDNNNDNDSRFYRKKVLSRFYTKQLSVLLWKSWIVRLNHYISTFFEILFPVLFIMLVCYIYSLTNSKNEQVMLKTSKDYYHFTNPENSTKGPVYYQDRVEFQIGGKHKSLSGVSMLYYQPVNKFTKTMMNNLTQYRIRVVPVDGGENEDLLEYQKFDEEDFGIFFQNLNNIDDIFLNRFKHKIKATMAHRSLLNKFNIKFNAQPMPDMLIEKDFYHDLGELHYVINNQYLKTICRLKNITGCEQFVDRKVTVYRMPYPEYVFMHNDLSIIFNGLGILLIYSYLVYVPLLVKRVLDEKSNKTRELLHMIGMTDGVYWLSHFINNFIVILFHCIAFTFMFFYFFKFTIVVYSSKFLIFFGLLLFGAQVILFSLFLTTLFPGPIFATITTTLLWIILNSMIWGTLHPQLVDFYPEKTANLYRRLMTLLPIGSIMFFFFQVGEFEQRQIGLSFTNLNEETQILTSFTALETYLIMMISIPMYCLLIFYFDNVWPFQERPKSPIFCLTTSYWFKDKNTYDDQNEQNRRPSDTDSRMFQKFQYTKPPVIVVDSLVKRFNSKTVLKDINVKIYSNEITVLLGHNGAGKSTLMNTITGMLSPTYGDIYVNGYNVQTQTIYARKSLSLCPQENIFFPELTVGQHLRLFALLKGISYEDVDKEVDEQLALLKLDHRKDDFAASLSGGMKRKLSLGIALIGDTDTVILDEPTSGMDPDTRRSIWDLLLKVRRRKTILLTTHFMEEADILGDRIIILNSGFLKCDGSPHFLKKSLGTGYRLKIGKLSGFDTDKFLSFLRVILPHSNMISNIETEVIYALETSTSDKKAFIKSLIQLFENMEAHREEMKVDSFGLSYSTLEDIFLYVGSDIEKKTFNHNIFDSQTDVDIEHETLPKNSLAMNNLENGSRILTTFDELYTDCGLIFLQLHGLLVKRFNYSRRNLFLILFQIIVPFTIILLSIYIKNLISDGMHGLSKSREENELNLNTVELYSNNTKTFLYHDMEIDQKQNNNDTQNMKSLLFLNNMRRLLKNKQSSHIKFDNKYVKSGDEHKRIPSMLKDVSDSVLKSVNNDVDDYRKNYLFGFGLIDNDYHVWINYEQTQSFFLALKTIFEASLCTLLEQESNCNEVKIQHSLFHAHRNNVSQPFEFGACIIPWAINSLIFFPIAFLFLMSSFTLFIIEENSNKSKLIQFMSRLSPVVYWFGNFFYDIIVHMTAIFLIVIMISNLDNSDILFSDKTQRYGFAFFVLTFLLGIGMIPMVYLLTFRCDRPSSGFVSIMIICLIFGFFPNMVVALVQLSKTLHDSNVFDGFYTKFVPVMRFVPIFAFMFGYQKVHLLSSLNEFCTKLDKKKLEFVCNSTYTMEQNCCPKPMCKICYQDISPFTLEDHGAGKEMLHLFFVGSFTFLLILYFETVFKKRFENFYEYCFLTKDVPREFEHIEDEDVRNERKRIDREINKQHESENILSVSHLHKKYSNLTAVYDVTFGVYPHECFGLLGVNGAGKTTTFSMLTGDIVPTDGEAYLNDLNLALSENTIAFQTKIGYCPQYDALVGRLTGEETLYFYARIKGIPFENMVRDVNNLIEMVGLTKHAKTLVDSYSGGNKRKLSLAIALIGNPMILLLDEPSCGVDPAARRKLWQTLGYIKKHFNCSIILTSHSMDECEALCSRVAIMVNGRFCCIGSTRHLRSKYGQGYSVIITLEPEMAEDKSYFDDVNRNVLQTFPSAFLKDYHQCSLSYHITDSKEKWSNIFRQMSILDERFHFNDYHVSDTTLEQIFLMFARGQNTYFARNVNQ